MTESVREDPTSMDPAATFRAGAGAEVGASGRSRWFRWSLGLLLAFGIVAVGLVVTLNPLLPAVGTPAVPIADVSSERLLASGSVVGFAADHDTHAWLGIPFARPPVGPLRWRAPQAPEAWAETFDALAIGSACPQLSSRLGGVPAEAENGFAGDEDCLSLNVWAPRTEPDAVPRAEDRLPVMVWIHGGGNTIGHGGSSMYDGARLAGTEGVVVVTINYRLGPFGWFSHPALRKEAANRIEASGNFGTLDQIRALEWVRGNIQEFGGDPANVTVFGESAGATNVLALLVSKPAAGLFHRAIAQSGSTDSYSRGEAESAHEIPDSPDAEVPGHRGSSPEIIVRLLVEAGVVPDAEAARRYAESLTSEDLTEFLRSRSPQEILEVARGPEADPGIAVPTLIRDGVVLPKGDWLALIRSGHFNAVPTLLGSNRDEMKLFHSQRDEYVGQRWKIFYRIRDLESYERRSRYASDLWRVRAVDRPATAISDSGRAPVFGYRFDWDEEPRLLGTDYSKLLGAAHGFEIPFVFGNFDLGDPIFNAFLFDESNRPGREALAEQMMSYWAEFARTGDPGRGGHDDLPEWPSWSADAGIRLVGRSNEVGGDGRNRRDGDPRNEARMLVLDTETDGGIRLATAPMTRDHVIAAVDSEPALDRREKCTLLREIFVGRSDWEDAEDRRFGWIGCEDDPVHAR